MSELTPENTWAAGMNFISLCSGIEAASVAFGPLGWKAIAFSEIEGFPSAVLAHHYPTVRNYGDMSLFRDWPDELFADADAIVGGPPCQAFSCAGARRGLLDARGNLTLIYVELLNHADDIRRKYGKPPIVALYENVPGIFSDRTNAFGCLVGGLAGEDVPVVPPGKRWTDAGCVFGPERAVAWRLFDAQFFGLAQRRRRVFVVASARKGFDPATVLFEWDGVRRDSAPSREARQTAPTIPARSTAGGGLGTDFDCDGGVITMAHGQGGAEIGFDRGPTLTCNHEAPIAAYGIRTANTSSNGWGVQEECTHTLDCAQGVAVAFHPTQDPISSTDGSTHALGCGSTGGQASVAVAVALRGREGGATAELGDEVQNCLRASSGGGDKPHVLCEVARTITAGKAESPPSIRLSFPASSGAINAEKSGREMEESASDAMSDQHRATFTTSDLGLITTFSDSTAETLSCFALHAIAGCIPSTTLPETFSIEMTVETPYTAIPWRGKPADQCPDGPRYKALGNSWAVPNVRWIGQRIDAAVRRLR